MYISLELYFYHRTQTKPIVNTEYNFMSSLHIKVCLLSRSLIPRTGTHNIDALKVVSPSYILVQLGLLLSYL